MIESNNLIGLNPIDSNVLRRLPLTQAVISDGGGNWNVKLSGMVPLKNLETGEVWQADMHKEATTTFGHIDTILEGVEKGGPVTLETVTVYLHTDLKPEDEGIFAQNYSRWTRIEKQEPPPARTTLFIARLPLHSRVEVVCQGIFPKQVDIYTIENLRRVYQKK